MHHTQSRERSARTALIVTLVLAAGSLLGGASVDAATKTPFDQNLVKNPGAEAGAGTSGDAHVTIPHWHVTDAFTVVRYGAPGFPTKDESGRIGGGKKFFSCGQDTASGDAFQDIVLSGRQTLVDNGHVKVIVKARLASYASQQDVAQASVSFFKGFSPISQIYTDSVAASDGLFITKSVSGVVPPSTNRLRVEMIGRRADNGGTYCDAYFDNTSVVLKLI